VAFGVCEAAAVGVEVPAPAIGGCAVQAIVKTATSVITRIGIRIFKEVFGTISPPLSA
jgi:hypothetical protein